jgi:hypothetical protein
MAPWTPPVDTCSRCDRKAPPEPADWIFKHDEGELVCPNCINDDDRGGVLGTITLRREEPDREGGA